MEISKENNSVDIIKNPINREMLKDFENILKQTEGSFIGDSVVCPLKHTFSPGLYVREITIPEDTLLVGKIHKHSHPNFLLEGEVLMITEDGGEEYIKAPCSMISKPGTKRALYTLTKVVWTTVHLNPTNTTDLEELEKEIIAKDFDEYEKFIIKESKIKKSLNV